MKNLIKNSVLKQLANNQIRLYNAALAIVSKKKNHIYISTDLKRLEGLHTGCKTDCLFSSISHFNKSVMDKHSGIELKKKAVGKLFDIERTVGAIDDFNESI